MQSESIRFESIWADYDLSQYQPIQVYPSLSKSSQVDLSRFKLIQADSIDLIQSNSSRFDKI